MPPDLERFVIELNYKSRLRNCGERNPRIDTANRQVLPDIRVVRAISCHLQDHNRSREGKFPCEEDCHDQPISIRFLLLVISYSNRIQKIPASDAPLLMKFGSQIGCRLSLRSVDSSLRCLSFAVSIWPCTNIITQRPEDQSSDLASMFYP
jgi:hypothetical protein